jgi:hypothetical protein
MRLAQFFFTKALVAPSNEVKINVPVEAYKD